MRPSHLLLALTCATLGCARTAMFSRPRLEARTRTIRRVLVTTTLGDTGPGGALERRIATHGVSGRFVFVTPEQVFAPGKPYAQAERVAALRAHDIDATLVIEPGRSGADSGWVPPTYGQLCPGADPTTACAQTTVIAGGYPYRQLWEEFSAMLYDEATGTILWTASGTTNGSQYASAPDLVRSLADQTARRLVDDRVLR